MIRLGVKGWELHRGFNCGGCEPLPGLRDRFWARQWLQQFKKEPGALYEIRRTVAESNTPWALSRITTDQVIDSMANLLRNGAWHVHAPILSVSVGPAQGGSAEGHEQRNPEELVSTRPSLGARPEPLPPPQEDGQLPRNADEEAIATAMKLAAKLGIPFCEECARAALKRAREAA